MDTERGNIEILFHRIGYRAISGQGDFGKRAGTAMHTHQNINKKLYMRCSEKAFPHMSENERHNAYLLACEQMKGVNGKGASIFRLLTDISQKLLMLDGDEIKCKFDQMLRWREISFLFGQDFFTCAYLADYDVNRGHRTKFFAWIPIIKSDNERLHHILEKGIAENHFHLTGSTKVFELNWISLMNQIDDRLHDFMKLERTLQEYYVDPFEDPGKRESFYAECQRGALYRVYLFSVMKEDHYLIEKLEKLLYELQIGVSPEEIVTDIQDAIILAKNLYGARIDCNVLDYALENSMIGENDNVCKLLAGERKFLYDCFMYMASGLWKDKHKNLFYAYLVIRTDFRGEIIQTNRQVGFANFSNYQDRKEYFIEGKKPYEDELVRLALNESLGRENTVSLEARICPKDSSTLLLRALKNYEHIVKKGGAPYDKLIYVLHFPKLYDKAFVQGVPRNDNVRRKSARQARSIVALLEKRLELSRHIKGIDACSSELACRPEVFGQVFRYLSDTMVTCKEAQAGGSRTRFQARNLHATYHAGEDFYDIVDGLRAIDEALLFCGLKRGSRLGHALALGIDPEEYYQYKGLKLVLSKQILLDDIAWMLCKAKEFGIEIDSSLKTRLEEQYDHLYGEIFGEAIGGGFSPSVYDYYQSWKLRGDNPDCYRLEMAAFEKKIKSTALERFDRYQMNKEISDHLRQNARYKDLYYAYHYHEQVRTKGNEVTEFKTGQSYAKLVRQIQDHMVRLLVCKGIGIETNPSSNYLIGTIKKYEEHPILRFNARKLGRVETNMSLSVSINTDDQGVFDTLLENEYALMALALKKAKDEDAKPLYDLEDIYEWIDYVRRMGIEQIFT